MNKEMKNVWRYMFDDIKWSRTIATEVNIKVFQEKMHEISRKQQKMKY